MRTRGPFVSHLFKSYGVACGVCGQAVPSTTRISLPEIMYYQSTQLADCKMAGTKDTVSLHVHHPHCRQSSS